MNTMTKKEQCEVCGTFACVKRCHIQGTQYLLCAECEDVRRQHASYKETWKEHV